ncbi:sugar phosphate isomerase/epimerase family protein [Albimonas pacifica]|uniref:Sugar phosphate isomerase/epimerase n=1 Tax=Albimonas pacifica TaxID=1114924 RepID=A0A1I3J2S2_9RHOB|nr:sugar phosphate isomerase/epimerase family protein [Albimonas pacifica]SFI54443.1 Sugar phosphate isomerase/epimerase [Albimonas pacifica]
MSRDLPVIGACLPVESLATYRDWLLEADRDLELQSFHLAEVLEGDWRPLVEEARRLLDGHKGRLGIHGPFWGFTVASMDPEIRRVVEKRMMQGLDVCRALGADQMVIHSPYTTWDHNNLDMLPEARAKVFEFTHDTLDRVVARAEDQGVTLVMENIQDKDPAERRRLVDSFGSERLKLSVDTGHAHYAHRSTGAPPVDYYITDAGAQLEHVHLQDADGFADRHWGLGEGTILWPSVFRAVAALSHKPRLVLELRDKARIPPSMAFLEAAGLGR